MTASTTVFPVLGKMIRVTKLDSCGRFNAFGTADSYIATDGFISIKLKAETEDGEEILVRKANGELCVNEKYADSFKYFTLEIEFCGVNPALFSMVSNAEPYLDYAGNITGFSVPEGTITNMFALELWTGLSGVACGTGTDTASGYMLLPFVNGGTLGDLEWTSKDAVTFSISGAYTRGGNGWGVGPYPVVYDAAGTPSALPTPVDPFDHLLLIETGLALPPSSDDPQPMPEVPATGVFATTTTTTVAGSTTTSTTLSGTTTTTSTGSGTTTTSTTDSGTSTTTTSF